MTCKKRKEVAQKIFELEQSGDFNLEEKKVAEMVKDADLEDLIIIDAMVQELFKKS